MYGINLINALLVAETNQLKSLCLNYNREWFTNTECFELLNKLIAMQKGLEVLMLSFCGLETNLSNILLEL